MMKKFFLLLTSLLLFCNFHFSLMAQTDTEFWFAPPDVSNQHNNSDDYIEIRLASVADVPVTVSLSQPANPGSPINALSTTINPGGSYTFNLSTQLYTQQGIVYKNFLETVPGGPVNTGLLISS